MKLRKCKLCGRIYVPTGENDLFCSSTCRVAGCFVAGGGDQTKPQSREKKKTKLEEDARSSSSRSKSKLKDGATERFLRVHKMFSLPKNERWALTRTFTKEELEYSRRLAKRMLHNDLRNDYLLDRENYDAERDPLGDYEGIVGGDLGDSDDGTI